MATRQEFHDPTLRPLKGHEHETRHNVAMSELTVGLTTAVAVAKLKRGLHASDDGGEPVEVDYDQVPKRRRLAEEDGSDVESDSDSETSSSSESSSEE